MSHRRSLLFRIPGVSAEKKWMLKNIRVQSHLSWVACCVNIFLPPHPPAFLYSDFPVLMRESIVFFGVDIWFYKLPHGRPDSSILKQFLFDEVSLRSWSPSPRLSPWPQYCIIIYYCVPQLPSVPPVIAGVDCSRLWSVWFQSKWSHYSYRSLERVHAMAVNRALALQSASMDVTLRRHPNGAVN